MIPEYDYNPGIGMKGKGYLIMTEWVGMKVQG